MGGGKAKSSRIPPAVWNYLPALLAFFACLTMIGDYDYWTNLALGRTIWERGSIRISEPFLGYAYGRPVGSIAPHHWLFELLLYSVYGLSGHAGVCVFVAILAAAVFGILWRILPEDANTEVKAIAVGVMAMALLLARVRFQPRPEVLSYLTASAALLVSYGWRARPSVHRLAVLGGLLLIWPLVHVSWAVGAPLAVLPIVLSPRADFWKALWKRRSGRVVVCAVSLLLATGAVFTLRFLLFVWGELYGERPMASISEMMPLWRFPRYFWMFLGISAMGLFAARGGGDGRRRRLALCVLPVGLGLLATRNVAFGVLGIIPPALEGLSSGRKPHPGLARVPPPVLSSFLVAILVFLVLSDRDIRFGPGVRWELFPVDAANIVKGERLPVPVVNSMEIGGYLDWAWNGDPPTFLDGRVIGDHKRYADTMSFLEGADPASFLEEYDARTVLMRGIYQNSGRIFPVAVWLLESPEWNLTRATDALVFTRGDGPRGVDTLPKREGWKYLLWETEAKAAEGGREPHLEYSRGVCLYHAGRLREAGDAFRKAVSSHPRERMYYKGYLAAFGIPTDG